jgi:hypothetical protein
MSLLPSSPGINVDNLIGMSDVDFLCIWSRHLDLYRIAGIISGFSCLMIFHIHVLLIQYDGMRCGIVYYRSLVHSTGSYPQWGLGHSKPLEFHKIHNHVIIRSIVLSLRTAFAVR